MDGLLKLTLMASLADVKKLRQTYDTIEAHVRGLQAARRHILKKQGRCFICLKRNHIARDCESRIAVSSALEGIITVSAKLIIKELERLPKRKPTPLETRCQKAAPAKQAICT